MSPWDVLSQDVPETCESDYPEKNILDSNPAQLEKNFKYCYLMLIGNPCC